MQDPKDPIHAHVAIHFNTDPTGPGSRALFTYASGGTLRRLQALWAAGWRQVAVQWAPLARILLRPVASVAPWSDRTFELLALEETGLELRADDPRYPLQLLERRLGSLGASIYATPIRYEYHVRFASGLPPALRDLFEGDGGHDRVRQRADDAAPVGRDEGEVHLVGEWSDGQGSHPDAGLEAPPMTNGLASWLPGGDAPPDTYGSWAAAKMRLNNTLPVAYTPFGQSVTETIFNGVIRRVLAGRPRVERVELIWSVWQRFIREVSAVATHPDAERCPCCPPRGLPVDDAVAHVDLRTPTGVVRVVPIARPT